MQDQDKYLEKMYLKRILSPIKGISAINNELIRQYIKESQMGVNLAPTTKRGGRSYSRLLALDTRLKFIALQLERMFNISNIEKTTDEQIIQLFDEMRIGKIKRKDDKPFRSVDSYTKAFTAFWHWLMRIRKKDNIILQDICLDMVKKADKKPNWVFLDEKQIHELIDAVKPIYKSLILFLFDSGLRSPKESLSTKISDLQWADKDNIYYLNVRDEVSKTFGRKIKLLLSSKKIQKYIEANKLKHNDFLFGKVNNIVFNRYLKRVCVRLFGNNTSQARGKYGEITMYDLRHCSACYWLPRYKSESALKYRFGWKNSNMVHYYSEFLGMTDSISSEDLLIDTSAHELQQKLEKEQQQRIMMQEQMSSMNNVINKMQKQLAKSVFNKYNKK
jgi:integrase